MAFNEYVLLWLVVTLMGLPPDGRPTCNCRFNTIRPLFIWWLPLYCGGYNVTHYICAMQLAMGCLLWWWGLTTHQCIFKYMLCNWGLVALQPNVIFYFYILQTILSKLIHLFFKSHW